MLQSTDSQQASNLSIAAIDRLDLQFATPIDCPALAELAHSAHSHPWSAQQYRDSFSSGHSCWLLRIPKQQSIAACCVTSQQSDTVEILDVAVAPQWRRRGIAEALLRRVFASLPADVARVLLEVRRSNCAARALYCKLGFSEDGRRKSYYPIAGGDREDAMLMSLDRI